MSDIYSILFLSMYVSTYRTLYFLCSEFISGTLLAQGQIWKDVN